MLLSADIISYELARCYALKTYCESAVMQYYPPLLIGPGQLACLEDPFLSTDESIAVSMSKNPLLISCGGGTDTCENDGRSAIVLDQPVDTDKVLNTLQSIFAKYDAWDRQLQRIAFEHRSFQELLESCVPFMQNDLGLLDARLSLQAVAYYDSQQKSTWDGQKEISRVIAELQETRDYRTPFCYVHTPDNPGYSTIGVNLFDGQMWIGMFILEGVRPFRKHDIALMDHAANFLKLILSRPSQDSSSGFNQVADIFREMIEKKHVDQGDLKHVWSIVGFGIEDRFQCLSVEVPPCLTPELRRYIANQLAFQAPSTVSVEFGGRIALLINQTRASTSQCEYLAGIRSLLDDLHIHAGLSGICSDTFSIRNFYASAEAALYLGLQAGDPETIYAFSRYSQAYALDHCTGELKPSMLYPEGLVRLIRHDESAPVSYVETLGIYLEEGRNAAQAARRLFIQRSSFLARLDHVLKLLDLDLDDPEVRQHLGLCISLHRGEKQRQSLN